MTNQYTMPKGSLISFMSNKVKTYGGINFAQGIPGFQPPAPLLSKLEEVAQAPVHQYAPGAGNLKLRKLILDHYNRYHFKDEQLLILQGATEALSLIFQYLKNHINEDFAAMAFDPVYESYRHLPRIMQVPFFAYENKHFDTEHLKNFIEQNNIRVIFINSPGNPFGNVFDAKQMDQMRKICEDLNVFMIIDAVYRDLWFDKPPHYPIQNISPEIFYINSFSKMLSITGWRIGYMIAHESHTNGLRDIHDYTGLCVNAPLQEALARYLETENYGKAYVDQIRHRLQQNYTIMTSSLKKLGFEIPEAKGGYYVWAQLPDYQDGFQFTMDLYENTGIAVIPGIHFSKTGKSHIRFNIARPEPEIQEGIKKLENFFRKRQN